MNIKKETRDFFLYVIVGGIATLAEWAVFGLLSRFSPLHYEISTVIAYIISTFVNWISGRIILFKSDGKNIAKELLQIYLASVIGLLLNMLIMWIAVDILNVTEMLSKIIATALVFFWNYLIRKLYIYNKKD